MSNLQLFNFNNFGVRVIEKVNQPWFVLKDVCEVLALGNPSQVKTRLDDGVISNEVIHDALGREQQTTVINEDGLYDVILESRKPEARAFRKWVTRDVLPSIRKTGMYAANELLDNPDLLIQAATKLKEEREARRALEEKIEYDRPKLVFAEALEVSKDAILVADLAKILKQNGIDIGEKRLFEELRKNGYLIKSGSEYNMPTQRSMDLKIMEVQVRQRGSAGDGIKITRTPKVTGKGIGYFINKYKSTEGR
ncbi:phage antirepressor KilAC domain-containing protein [Paenibacillus filicis]|uniref:Phage antirepressor KilAC domain-containing protein n=1 Tax=Paenibacillus filicis TaxID=669464 RepID=A0ABU9DY08_9BACL